MSDKIPVGVSSCLLGQEVRFDGGHKHARYLTKVLAEYFDWLPFCPEMAAGMGVPRETVHLSRDQNGKIWVEGNQSHQDYTAALDQAAEKRVKTMPYIAGYVLKSKSPSCGMERVNVYNPKGMPEKVGVGRFVVALQGSHPELPIEEEGRLNDSALREHFIKRVYAYHDWHQTCANNMTVNKLVLFHSRHKFLLILHHYGNSKVLGRIVAEANEANLQQCCQAYFTLFMETLKRLPAKRHHGQVLHRVVGTINEQLSDEQRQDVLRMIQEYLSGYIPLAVPVRLINHYLTNIDEPYLKQQSYLSPYPEALGLMTQI